MRRVGYPLLLCMVAVTAPIPSMAQDEDGGSMIERFLQDTLSGEDQNVRVIGLEGALSSRARIQEITVADDEGVWLTIKNAVLDWNRLALIRGRFSVNALTAQEIDIARAPGTTTKEKPPPSAETEPFQLPELPVSIEIGELRIDQLSLGQPLIGVAADLAVNGDLSLSDGALDTTLDIDRLDRAGDTVDLVAGFENSTRQIDLDLTVAEASGGLISTALGIPGSPPLGLTAKGSGPLTDFTADIGLSSDSVERLGGQVRLRSATSESDDDADGIAFTADLGGDLTPFLAEEMDTFFGTDTKLYVDGRTHSDGALDISDIEITSQALKLEGQFSLASGGALQMVAVQGRITPPDGDRVVLPISGGETSVGAAHLSALYDVKNGNLWDLSLTADDVLAAQLDLQRAQIAGQGTLTQDGGLTADGDIQVALDGIDMSDPALNAAVGNRITLDGQFDYGSDQTVKLSGFELLGRDYSLETDAIVSGLSTGLKVEGAATVLADDLSRFSQIAKLDLGGMASISVEGSGSPLERSFDGKVTVGGRNLSTGRDDIDPVITGETDIFLDAKRASDGITIRSFTISSETLDAKADGVVTTTAGNLTIDGSADVNADDLSIFSGLAKRNLSGSMQVKMEGKGTVQTLEFDGTANIVSNDIRTGMTEIDPLLTGRTTIELDGARTQDQVVIRNATVKGNALNAQVAATIDDLTNNISADGQAQLDIPNLSLFSGLAKRDLGGSVQLQVDGKGTVKTLEFDGTANAVSNDIRTGLAEIDPLLTGRTTIELDGARTKDQVVIRNATVNGSALTAQVAATIDDPTNDISADGKAQVDIPDLSVFSGLAKRDLSGSVRADVQGRAAQSDRTFDVQGTVTADDIKTGIDNVDALIQGRTTLNVDAVNDDQGLDIRTFKLNGTALTATASGKLDRTAGGLDFSAALDDIGRVSPIVSGQLKLDGNVAPTSSGLEGSLRLQGPESSYADLQGTVTTDGAADLDFEAQLNRIERFAPEFPGTISATGNARRDSGVWTIDAKADGPAQINSTVAGTFDEASGEADLTMQGGVNIGIANRFIEPNTIEGTASFDLTLKGPPALDALSGTVTTSGTAMALPGVGQTITGIGGSITLDQSRATIAMQGGVRAGGGFTVNGPVNLTPPFNAQITTAINELVLTDKLLYETTLNGQIVMNGALAGNSSIAGQINFGETNINLAAAAGAVGAAPIPDIEHVNESNASFVTRERAQLVVTEKASKSTSRISLDIGLLAPKAVFVRGRGVNAELGGRIQIGGTTASVVPSGQIELIRGNIDILGRRLALTKGLVTLQGDLTPYIEFESSTSTSDGTATIEIAGPLDSPQVDVFSDPERPTEEALAMLLFGNRFSELSPFVIAQMAASLAQLSGAGGDATKGVRDATGVDTVDVGTTEEGAGRLGAGAYLSDNLYTDFTVNTEGDTEVNLNLDVTDSFTVRGTVDGRGETGLGVFFERDY
ncbi:translocation/assembly module TamB domain-containing protein [Ruegeria arenilitoris]|uniref:translocation/assembly module TamB domain-containing protein n=1 Tax=Ruegeria arenilitoris TaxID=1173585 RepID=UPI0020C323AD|nr:translocation/assembly module TamB domain-containing protein [Ruegeria arenilitoris]